MHSEIPFTPIRRCRRCRLFRPLTHFPWEDKGIFFREQARYCHDCYDFHHQGTSRCPLGGREGMRTGG